MRRTVRSCGLTKSLMPISRQNSVRVSPSTMIAALAVRLDDDLEFAAVRHQADAGGVALRQADLVEQAEAALGIVAARSWCGSSGDRAGFPPCTVLLPSMPRPKSSALLRVCRSMRERERACGSARRGSASARPGRRIEVGIEREFGAAARKATAASCSPCAFSPSFRTGMSLIDRPRTGDPPRPRWPSRRKARSPRRSMRPGRRREAAGLPDRRGDSRDCARR